MVARKNMRVLCQYGGRNTRMAQLRVFDPPLPLPLPPIKPIAINQDMILRKITG
jgi:hypothetical protein